MSTLTYLASPRTQGDGLAMDRSVSGLRASVQCIWARCSVEGAVPVSARVCDFNPRKTCLTELGGVRKESELRGSSSQEN